MFYTYVAYNFTNKIHSIGVSNNLFRRFKLLNQQLENAQKDHCKLVYYEEFLNSEKATIRENKLQELHESLLKVLITESNPMLVDLLNNEIIKTNK